MSSLENRHVGCLLGLALGDATGAPYDLLERLEDREAIEAAARALYFAKASP